MRKLFLLLILVCGSMNAQTVNGVLLKDIDVEYIEVVGAAKLMSAKLNVSIDFGQSTKFFSAGTETKLNDSNGQAVVFNSMIDALNFMSNNGYEFTTAYIVTLGTQNVYHYLLRKRK